MPIFNFKPSWKKYYPRGLNDYILGEDDPETKEPIDGESEKTKHTVSDLIGTNPPDINNTKNDGSIK